MKKLSVKKNVTFDNAITTFKIFFSIFGYRPSKATRPQFYLVVFAEFFGRDVNFFGISFCLFTVLNDTLKVFLIFAEKSKFMRLVSFQVLQDSTHQFKSNFYLSEKHESYRKINSHY